MTSTTTPDNGVDVGRLVETIEAVKDDPNLAAFTFRAKSSWEHGMHNVGEISTFTHADSTDESRVAPYVLHGDEPPALLGTNKGPNAVELLLQSLAFCYAAGYAANAAAQGIQITRMEYEIEGDVDVRAFLGLEGARPGLTGIRAKGRISSPNATPEQLAELCSYVQDTSPVRDCLANPVPVETTLEVV
ncbi:putative OsmC-like protein [Lipingzhangella halophila]|uniref:Putative OsmC-like protein n=1 Tax=Lipingzhangella halophila TaxID=1783352 RepID=A0A7W7RK28_9ACTN|nr:OsmC family protein [Lipingzhangella halophila]MBB4932966.1 putative OsmC-like protein [Lipingzhangella halophila]